MFGRSRSVRSKQVAEALRAGRLEDALRLVTAGDANDSGLHDVKVELCERLLGRAQEHLIQERFADALRDLEGAARCRVLGDKVEEWRQRALAAMQDRARQRRVRREAIDAAGQHLQHGELTLAAEQIADLGDGAEAARLAERADRRRQRAAAAIVQARDALRRGAIAEAVREYFDASREHPNAEGLPEAEAEIGDAACRTARAALAEGRPDRARATLALLGDLGRTRGERADLELILSLAARAADAIESGAPAEAVTLLGRVAQAAPDLTWVEDARDHLRQLETHRAALREGPLGFLMSGAGPAHPPPAADETRIAPALPPAAPRGIGILAVGTPDAPRLGYAGATPVTHEKLAPLPDRLLLRIDGAGSFLILRSERVVIGRAGPAATADLPLVSDLPERVAEIVRADDDYFLIAVGEVRLGDQPVRQALLNHQDRLRLGAKQRLTFLRPSRKSNSAVLELGLGARTVADVRRVVLMGGPLLVGPTAECHVPVAAAGLILVQRGRQLAACRWAGLVGQRSSVPIAEGAMTPLTLSRTTEIDGLRMSLSEWTGADSIGRLRG